jgi:hypothetical protein
MERFVSGTRRVRLFSQHFFHVAEAERKAQVYPDAVADDLRGKAVTMVGRGWKCA